MSAFLLLDLYFNTSEPLNAPLKIFETVMLVTFMLYFTAEAGMLIARPKMNRKYMFAGILAVSSGGMVAISKIAARIIDPDTFPGDLVKPAFYAVIWLYILISFAERIAFMREKTKEEALLDSEYGKSEKKKKKEETEEDGYFDIATALPADEDEETPGEPESKEEDASEKTGPDEEPEAGPDEEESEEKFEEEESEEKSEEEGPDEVNAAEEAGSEAEEEKKE